MNTSPDVRQLRILSGAHAGASLDLSLGIHSLGRGDDCDITITDWAFEPLALHFGGKGEMRAQWVDTAPRSFRFEDFVPVDFAGIAVCLGPIDGSWPDDTDLLAAARAPAVDGMRNLPRRALAGDRRAISVVAIMIAVPMTFGGFVSAISKPSQDARLTPQSSRASIQRALDAVKPGRLMVSVSQGGLAVDGIVDTAEQRQAVLKVLENAPGRFPVARHVSVATELAESIRSALGVAGASVSYRGGGVFRVAVDSADVAGTQAALARVAADLAPVVKHIEADVHEITTQAELPATRSSMTTDGVSVKETRDGVKHLVLTEPEQDATVIAELPIAPPTAAVPSSRAKP